MSADVRVERAGNRIFLSSNFPTPGLKQAIPGAYWSNSKELWSVPLDLATCHLLRERFGRRLKIGPDLTAWARAEKAQRDSQAATAAADDATLARLPEVAPRLHAAMGNRRYQRAAVRFILDARGRDDRRRTLVADTVGLGKTVEAIGAVLESGQSGPFLVICPKTAVNTAWTPEIRQWIGDQAEIITLPETKNLRMSVLQNLRERYARNPASLARTWIVLHPEAVRTQTWWICGRCREKTKFKAGMVQELDACGHVKDKTTKIRHDHVFPHLFELEYGAIIADESDQILIRTTGTPNLRRRGAEMLRDLVRPEGLRIAMSGTPFRSKPHQIWSTLNWLDPVRWGSKWNFLGKFWQLGGYSGYTVGDMIPEREGMLEDELKDVMIRRTREQVRGDLPPKIYPSNVQDRDDLTPGIYLPMTSKQQIAYEQMYKMGEAELEGGTLNAIGVLAQMTRLKQFAGCSGHMEYRSDGYPTFIPHAEGNKYEWLLEFMEELGFPDRPASKLVIASQFTSVLNVFGEGITKAFGTRKELLRAEFITGQVTGPKRTAHIAEFEDVNSGLDVLFINTKAGGSAITLDAADVMAILDETYVDDEQQQLEGRIDNRQPERRIAPRSYYYLRSLNSIDEGISRKNADARRRGLKVLDGSALAKLGKEVAR